MSKEQNVSESGRPDQPPPGLPTVGPGLPASHLTVENVKKIQEDYPAAASSLARQSVEAYLQQSRLLGREGEASREEGRREPHGPHDAETEAGSVGPREGTAENDAEPSEEVSNPDFQRRPLISSAPETKKHGFADRETQTEWSYSSPSLGSSKAARRTTGPDNLEREAEGSESEARVMGRPEAEGRDMIEIGSTDSSQEAVADMVLEGLHRAEDNGTFVCTLGSCEFCAAALKPFPTPEELNDKPEKIESVSCCRTYRELLQYVMQELMEAQLPEGEIDITPHRRMSQTILDSKTRSLLMEELKEHGLENYREFFQQYMALGPWVRVRYKLEDQGRRHTLLPVKKKPQLPKELLKIDVEFKPEQMKICNPNKPVIKYYPDGKIFFLLLPDGTGQVYYPSGNIAILITYLKSVQFSYFILADRSYSNLLAFFTNQGYATCYYPNGNIRVHLDLCWGSSLDRRGFQEKHWSWWDKAYHVHAPPFQPICIQLNAYIQVKIKVQDQVFLTFTKLHNCICLNAGARLKLDDPAMLPILKSSGEQKPSVSQAEALKIKTLLTQLRKGVRQMHSAPSEQVLRVDLVALLLTRLKRWQQKSNKNLS